ncbi:MAG TPA: Wzz/FepE/Etk N-terminal domain-containing protein [Sphingomonas sp.]|jgi:capsular exopolysaccharide synthesis family protein
MTAAAAGDTIALGGGRLARRGSIRDDGGPTSSSYVPGLPRAGYLGAADFLRVLRRRWLLVASIAAVGIALTLVMLARTNPIYNAVATVVINPPDASEGLAQPATVVSPSEDIRIETKVQLLQSRVLARKTALSLQLGEKDEFAPASDDQDGWVDRAFAWLVPPAVQPLDTADRVAADKRAHDEAVAQRLIDRLNVERVNRSNVVAITASSTEPRLSAQIANRLVDTYMRGQINGARKAREEQISGMIGQVEEARVKLQEADQLAVRYRREHGLLTSRPEEFGNGVVAQLAPMLAQSRADSASQARRAGGGAATSGLLDSLRQQQTVLLRRSAELRSFYGAGYPEVAKTDAELAALTTRIAAEARRLGADMNTEVAANQARGATLAGQIASVRAKTFDDGGTAVPLRTLERNADAANAMYVSLLARLNEKMTSGPDNDPDVTFVSKAAVPETPAHPVPRRTLGVAAIASTLLGLIMALVVEMMDIKLRTAEQVRRLLGLPVLAMIPDLGGEEEQALHRLVGTQPRSRFAEAMRNLLIELESRREGSGSHVVVVTSPLEREGKNTMSTSIAAAAAAIGRNAVVVDFDLRRPGLLHLPIGPSAATGVVAFLNDAAKVDDLVAVRDEARFAVIGAGEVTSDPGSLIASPRLPILIKQLRERYDTIVINAPPLLPVRDAKTLADLADSTLLVLRWGKTDPEAARVAIELFDRPIAGAVLNMVDYPVHARRRYGDSIHHVSRHSEYFDDHGASPRWPQLRRAWMRLRRWSGGGGAIMHR